MWSVIIAAAGNGARMETGVNKIFIELDGKPMLIRTLEKFLKVRAVKEIIIAYNPKDKDAIMGLIPDTDKIKLIEGGSTRTDSIRNALKFVTKAFVLVHDAARPYVSTQLISNVMHDTAKYGACIPVLPVTDTVKTVDGEFVTSTLTRDNLRRVQTPQGFTTSALREAYDSISSPATDDSSIFEQNGGKVHCIAGEQENIKVTTKDDLVTVRIGNGFDTHRLVEGRPLILGGVTIPYSKGLLGHSDADVVVHAIMDSLLSSVGLRDIGVYFPDTDNKYKDISSLILLNRVKDMLTAANATIVNVTASILAEKPKLMHYIPHMKRTIAATLGIAPDRVSLSATTTEGIGYVGREEGISTYAVSLIKKSSI